MRRVIDWIRSWFIGSKVSRQLSGSDRRLQDLDTRCSRYLIQLEKRQRRFDKTTDKIQTRFDEQVGILEVELNNSRQLCKQFESALEEVREKNIVLETTIQTLTASHKLLIERYDAECSVEVRRKTTASISE